MIIKGNSVYGDIEIHTKEEAIETILKFLNNYQIKWDVVYAQQLLHEFEISKDDFIFYELSLYYGVYNVYYRPHHTEEELEIIRKECEDSYAFDLIENLSREIKECKDNGMTYDDIKKYFNMHDLKQATFTTSRYLQKIRSEQFINNTDIFNKVSAIQ